MVEKDHLAIEAFPVARRLGSQSVIAIVAQRQYGGRLACRRRPAVPFGQDLPADELLGIGDRVVNIRMRVKAVDVEYAVEDIADREVAIGKIGHRGFEQLAAGDEDEIGIGRREEIFHVRNHVQHLHAAQAGGSVLLGPGGYLLELGHSAAIVRLGRQRFGLIQLVEHYDDLASLILRQNLRELVFDLLNIGHQQLHVLRYRTGGKLVDARPYRPPVSGLAVESGAEPLQPVYRPERVEEQTQEFLKGIRKNRDRRQTDHRPLHDPHYPALRRFLSHVRCDEEQRHRKYAHPQNMVGMRLAYIHDLIPAKTEALERHGVYYGVMQVLGYDLQDVQLVDILLTYIDAYVDIFALVLFFQPSDHRAHKARFAYTAIARHQISAVTIGAEQPVAQRVLGLVAMNVLRILATGIRSTMKEIEIFEPDVDIRVQILLHHYHFQINAT